MSDPMSSSAPVESDDASMQPEQRENVALNFLASLQQHLENGGLTEDAVSLLQTMTSTPLAAPVPAPAPIPVPAPAFPSSLPKVKLADPKKFTGKAGDVDKFIRTMDSRFRIRSYASYTDYEKIQVLVSFLAPPADDWHDAISTSRPALLNNYKLYVAAFRSHYKSATHQQDLLGKLDKLCQIGTAADYVSRFVALADQVGIDDITQHDKFFRGLKAEIRHGLSLQVLPTALFEQITQTAISVDYALSYNARVPLHPGLKGKPGASYTPSVQYSAHLSHNSNNNSRPPAAASSTSAPPSSPWPMEIDSVHSCLIKGKLPKEELERRVKNNLCLYCGLSGHTKDSCPTKSDKSKAGKDTPRA